MQEILEFIKKNPNLSVNTLTRKFGLLEVQKAEDKGLITCFMNRQGNMRVRIN